MTQGPPDRLHPVEYMRYISLSVSLSSDRTHWKVRDRGGVMVNIAKSSTV